jgi:hypothetical protein
MASAAVGSRFGVVPQASFKGGAEGGTEGGNDSRIGRMYRTPRKWRNAGSRIPPTYQMGGTGLEPARPRLTSVPLPPTPNCGLVHFREPFAHEFGRTSVEREEPRHVTSRLDGSICRGFGDGASRARTGDLLGAIQALSQLSYSPAVGEV